MTLPQRPLTGCVINLSISDSDDSIGRGFPPWQVDRVILQIVAALYGQGASLAFGQDWREDGIMEAVYGFARQVQAPLVDDDAGPLLRNLVPWPDTPYLPEKHLEQLRSTLRVEAAGLPEELREYDVDARHREPTNPLRRYVRARGLTFLRHRLNHISHVRLCLGGRRYGHSGRYPGVIEEAFLAVRDGKPLYLAGFLGGATRQVVDAIHGEKMTNDFCPPFPPIEELYEAPPVKELNRATGDDRLIDRASVWKVFAEIGPEKLAATNGLTVKENSELFRTPVIDRAIELVLVGLSRIWPKLAPSG